MKNPKLSVLLAATIATVSIAALAKADSPPAGQAKSVVCASCHGVVGISSTDTWPSLAGQGYAYLVKQLRAFRDGTRKDAVMEAVAKSLSDGDIDDLASFYAAQKGVFVAGSTAQHAAESESLPHAPIISSPDIFTPTQHTTPQYWVDRLPQGEGRSLVIAKCQACHTLQRGIAYARPREEWRNVVEAMKRRGAPVAAGEVEPIAAYLAKNFGPDSPAIEGRKEVGMTPCKRSEWPRGSSSFRGKWKQTYNIWVSNQQGGNVDVVDPVSKRILNRIGCISAPDRVEFSRDGNTAYVPDRVEHDITVIDTRTGAFRAKIPLIDRPNSVAISLDSRKLYVGIWPVTADEDKRGYIQVIDTATLKIVKTIRTKGGIHLPVLSRDGKLLMALSSPGKFIDVYDTKTDALLYTCCTQAEVGTMNMDVGPDGGNDRILFSYAGYPGVVAADARTGKERMRVDHPPDTEGPYKGVQHPIGGLIGLGYHGSEISPDGKTYWVISASAVYRYDLPSLKPHGNVLLASVDQTGKPLTQRVEGTGLTISPDGQKVYAIRGARNLLSVIDVKTMKEEALIPTGEYGLHVTIWPGSARPGAHVQAKPKGAA